MSMRVKLRLSSTVVIPSDLYGIECWVLRKAKERKLLAFEMKCSRRIGGITWEDREK